MNTLSQGNNAALMIRIDGSVLSAGANGLVITAGGSTVRGLIIGGLNPLAGPTEGNAITLDGGDNNLITGNYLGTDPTGTSAAANARGIVIRNGSSGNIIGTNGDGVNDLAEANLISGQRTRAIWIQGDGSDNNIIAGNLIGTNAAGTGALPNQENAIVIGESGNPKGTRIGTDANGTGDAAERNVISGNSKIGIVLLNAGVQNTVIAGNYLGLDATGTADLGNGEHGIAIFGGATANRVGSNGDGTNDAAERNVISGNNGNGIIIANSAGNTVAGNFIGTNAAGTGAVANSLAGVRIENAGTNTVGALGATARNVISGNLQDGIVVAGSTSGSTLIVGNLIGLDATGATALGNAGSGVFVSGAPSTQIGGDNPLARNIISANGGAGVSIEGATATVNYVQGNYIGTDITGALDRGNVANGVALANGTLGNLIGGFIPAEGNVIAGNGGNGVRLENSNGNIIGGNQIGTNAAGGAALPNDLHGIAVLEGSSNNYIGSLLGGRAT